MEMHQRTDGDRLARLENELHDLCRLIRGNGMRGLVVKRFCLGWYPDTTQAESRNSEPLRASAENRPGTRAGHRPDIEKNFRIAP